MYYDPKRVEGVGFRYIHPSKSAIEDDISLYKPNGSEYLPLNPTYAINIELWNNI